MADAHRAILYVDEVNLLDDHIVDVLLDSAAMGVNTIEREGVSFFHPAHFILIGTMNPEEGELRPQLLDRFGLCVNIEGIDDPKARVEVIKRRQNFEENPARFVTEWSEEGKALSELIVKAQKLLNEVVLSEGMLELIARIAVDMQVDGHRADIFMMKASRTIAAYHERAKVTEEDVQEAAEFVLPHRMRKKPFQDRKMDQKQLEQTIQEHKKQKSLPQQSESNQNPPPQGEDKDQDGKEDD